MKKRCIFMITFLLSIILLFIITDARQSYEPTHYCDMEGRDLELNCKDINFCHQDIGYDILKFIYLLLSVVSAYNSNKFN